jgi:hypothetical protein
MIVPGGHHSTIGKLKNPSKVTVQDIIGYLFGHLDLDDFPYYEDFIFFISF